MNIKLQSAFLSVLLLIPALCRSQRQWTLQECIEYAYEHNIDIQQRELQIQQGDLLVDAAKKARVPDLSFQLGEQLSFGNYNLATGFVEDDEKKSSDQNNDLSYTSGRLSLSVPIYNGSRLSNGIKASQADLKEALANLELARKNIGILISTYYLQCLYYKSMVDVADAQVGMSRRLLERATALVAEGKRPRSEQAEAESQLANDEYLHTDAKGQVLLSLLSLGQLLNLENIDDFDVAGLNDSELLWLQDTPDEIFNGVAETYPSILSAKAGIESGKMKIKMERAGYYPTIAFQGYVGAFVVAMLGRESLVDMSKYNFFRNSMNEVVGLHINIPLIHAKTRNAVRLANLDVQNRELRLADARQDLRKEIQTAYYNADVARTKYDAAEKAVISSLITVGYEQERYDAGRSSIFDLQQAQQKSLQAQHNAVRSKYEYLVRKRILDFYYDDKTYGE